MRQRNSGERRPGRQASELANLDEAVGDVVGEMCPHPAPALNLQPRGCDTLSRGRGVTLSPNQTTTVAPLQGDLLSARVTGADEPCRKAISDALPANARQSPECVPASHPRAQDAPSPGNKIGPVAGLFFESPLTDSNRRPPPCHGSPGAVLAYTAGHSRHDFSCKAGRLSAKTCVARRRACRF